MKILDTYVGEREVTLIEKRAIGRKPSYTNPKPQEKRYAIYLDAKTEYAWFRRKKEAVISFDCIKESLAQIKRNST